MTRRTPRSRGTRALAVRLDSEGDVLLVGPAVRALAATYDEVDLLVSGSGLQAAALLPGVARVIRFDAPWTGFDPPDVDAAAFGALVSTLVSRRYDVAVIFTSYHQSSLPMALVARLAGVPRIVATSEDYPGSLLDVRHQRPPGLHESEAALHLARAAGAELAPEDDGLLGVRRPLPAVPPPGRPRTPGARSVVVHPGASVPARAPHPQDAAELVARLARDGWEVLVTGSPAERRLTSLVAGDHGVDLGGRTTLAELAAVLDQAACVVVGNTGPAHLAAAVGTPVVSLFAPLVPADRWAPFGVPHLLLGDQSAACRGTRARTCPVPGHPCLASVTPEQVSDAVVRLAGEPHRVSARAGRRGEQGFGG